MDYSKSKAKTPATTDTERVKLDPVVTQGVTRRKRSLGSRIKQIFFGGDAKEAASTVAAEVIFPAIRNVIVDSANQGIRRMVYGENAQRLPPSGPGSDRYRSRTTYQHPVRRQQAPYPRDAYQVLPDQAPRLQPRGGIGSDIILHSREDAELVVERMSDILDQYERVSVADLYDLLNMPTSMTDNKWGWRVLPSPGIAQVREGWLIELPNAEPI